MLLYWLIQRFSSYQYKFSAFLWNKRMIYFIITIFTFLQHTTVLFLDQSFALIKQFSFINENYRVPMTRNRQIKLASRVYVHIKVVGRSPCVNGTCFSLPFAWYYLYLNFVFVKYLNFVTGKLLIGRRFHFICTFQVDPKLESKWILLIRGRNLGVKYASTSCHPLKISRTYLAFMAFEIFMIEVTLEHISDSLESSVGMIGKSCRKSDFEEIKH